MTVLTVTPRRLSSRPFQGTSPVFRRVTRTAKYSLLPMSVPSGEEGSSISHPSCALGRSAEPASSLLRISRAVELRRPGHLLRRPCELPPGRVRGEVGQQGAKVITAIVGGPRRRGGGRAPYGRQP